MVVSRSIRQRRKSPELPEDAPLNVDESGSTIEVESDDSKDSGRLSQDDGQEALQKESTTDTSDNDENGITFGKKKLRVNTEESEEVVGSEIEGDGALHDEVGGGGTDEVDRRMSLSEGYEAVATTEEDQEESCLLGIDCNELSTVGLVLRIYADTKIHLDGDG